MGSRDSYTPAAADVGQILTVFATWTEGSVPYTASASIGPVGIRSPIDYGSEKFSFNDAACEMTADPSGTALISNGNGVANHFGKTVYIRVKAVTGPPETDASAWWPVEVPQRRNVPNTVNGGVNRITGVTADMEYCKAGDTDWTACTDTTVTGLSAGQYEVRLAATDSKFASPSVTVSVSQYVAPVPAVDWQGIIGQINQMTEGQLEVDMNGTTELPQELLEALKGKNVTVILDMGGGVLWAINGRDVDNPRDLDLGIALGGGNIPQALIDALAAGKVSLQIHLNHDGALGFQGTITIHVGVQYAGLWVNLYKYEGGALVFKQSVQVGDDGLVKLIFSSASDYLAVLDAVDHAVQQPQMTTEYLLLEVGQEARLDAGVMGATWTVSGNAVSVDATGLVKAKAAGSATVTATIGQNKATCQIDVVDDLNQITKATLKVKKLAVPVHSEQGTTLEYTLVIPESAKAGEPIGSVIAAAFTKDKAARDYTLTVIDDRTLQVKANPGAKKRVSPIALTLSNGNVLTTKSITLTASQKLPEITGTLVLENGAGTLTLNQEVKTLALVKAPKWLTFNEEKRTATLTGDFKKGKKITLQATLEGWTKPVEFKVKITRKK